MLFKNIFKSRQARVDTERASPGDCFAQDLNIVQHLIQKNQRRLWNIYDDKSLEDLYIDNELVRAPIWAIATAISEGKLVVGQELDNGFIKINHPLDIVFKRPNPNQSYRQWMANISTNLLTTGKVFIEELKGNDGLISLQIWPTSWCILFKSGQIITHVEVNAPDGQRRIIPKKNLIYIFDQDYGTTLHGSGPLRVALRAIQLDIESQNYKKAMISNNDSAGLILKVPNGIPEDHKKDIRKWAHQKLGNDKRGSLAILEGDEELTTHVPLKDIEWDNLNHTIESRLTAAFKVPPIVVNFREKQATYSNTNQFMRQFYRSTVIPWQNLIADILTASLILDEGDDPTLVIKFDNSDIKELDEDKNEMAKRIKLLIESNVISIDEAREMMGLEVKTDINVENNVTND